MDFNEILAVLEARAREQLKPGYIKGTFAGFFLATLPFGPILKIPLAIFLSSTVGGPTQAEQKNYNAGVIFGLMIGNLWKK